MNKDEHFEKNDTKRYSQEFNSNNDSILDHFCNVKQLESKQNENITDNENKENNLHGSLNHIGEKDANNIENQTQERDISCSNSTINESKESGRNDFERQSNYKSVFSKFLELISRYESPMNQSEPWELPSADITNDKFKENNVHKILSQVNQNDSINSLDQTEKSGTFNAVIQHINKDGYFENHDAKKNSLGLNSNDDIFDYFDNIKPQESKRKENITDNENKENNLHDSLNHTDEKDANNIENQTKERGISCSISTINESNENGRNDFEQSNYSSASKKALELLSRYEFSMNQSKPWELLGADITNDEFKENNVHKNLSQVNQNDSINSLDQTEKSGTFNAVIQHINKDGYFENHDAKKNSLGLNSNDDIFDYFDNIKPQESKRNENITDNENKENNLHDSLFRNESCMNQPKPWELPGADITDWFNYGLNEETWKAYFNRHVRMRKEASNECNRTENNTSSNLKQIKIQKTNSGSYPYYQQQSNTSRNFDRTRPTSNYGQFHNYYELSEQNAASTWNSNYCHDSFLMNNDQSYFQAYVASQCSSYNYNSDSAQTNYYNSYKPIQSNSYNYNYETMQSDSHKNYETVQCNFYNYSFGTAQVNPHNSFEATKSNSYNYNYETARSSFHDSSEATQSNSYNYNSETSRSSSHDSFEATKSNFYNYNYETARSNFHDGFEATQSNSYNYNSETSRSSFHDSSEATKFNSYNYNYEIARSGWERDYVGVSSRSFNSKLATVYKKEE